MNAPAKSPLPFDPALSNESLAVLAPPPTILPGESVERYYVMREAILSDIAPASALEWLVAMDVVELSWEIERYRILRHKLLERYRERAIERCLSRIDLPEISSEFGEAASREIRRNALDWQTDPQAAIEIEARLAAYGIDQQAINAETLVQAREFFLLFQALIDAAQMRRACLLRDLSFQRAHRRPGRNREIRLSRVD